MWDDETERNWRMWHIGHYGIEAPEVKMKGVKMVNKTNLKTSTTGGNTMGIGANPENTLETKTRQESILPGAYYIGPKAKRHRRPKGLPNGVTVETVTTRIAFIDLFIPERPEGVNSVFLRIHGKYRLDPFVVEWREGLTDLEAIKDGFAEIRDKS